MEYLVVRKFHKRTYCTQATTYYSTTSESNQLVLWVLVKECVVYYVISDCSEL